MKRTTKLKKYALALFLVALTSAAAWGQDDPILLDETASDKIMPIADTTSGLAVIFYTYSDGDDMSIRSVKLTNNGVESKRNTIAEDVIKSSGDIFYTLEPYDTPANWYATWHRNLKEYLVVYATENGVFARRVLESGAPRGAPKAILKGDPFDNLVVVQSGAKNYILFYKDGMQTYAQLLRKTGAKKGKAKAIAGGPFFGDAVPLDAFCDSKTNAVLFYGTYTVFGGNFRFSAAMYRTNKSLNPIMHQAFTSVSETEDFGGILAASSRNEEKFFAMWPSRPYDLEADPGEELFPNRPGYAAIASEDGEDLIFDGALSGSILLAGVATNQITGNYWILYGQKLETDATIKLYTVFLTNERDSGGFQEVATLSNTIYGLGYEMTVSTRQLVCYSFEEDGEARTYLKIVN